ncbi:hypothetical protein ACH4UT_23430 [Streptomyces sp. NPDC020799]|uniref:hypothetical protein n=1 Tax=Streptomyces sp. NPDC020799 TaxID=3365091 RepID=UPI0034811C42
MNELGEQLEEALAEVLGEDERGMLARAVVIAEVLDDDGERTLMVMTTPGVTKWDALGLCRYGALCIEGPAASHFAGGGEE